jgi:hypothetical protein
MINKIQNDANNKPSTILNSQIFTKTSRHNIIAAKPNNKKPKIKNVIIIILPLSLFMME